MSAAVQTIKIEGERLCVECHVRPIHHQGDKARFCADCISRHQSAKSRHRPRIYVAAESIDHLIREHYLKRVTNGGHPRLLPTLEQLGKKIGWPKFAVQQRARRLGVTRVKEKPWSAVELALLERYAYLTSERLHMRFAKAGFNRSAAGINIQLKRRHLRSTHEFYAATYLAGLFGVDSHLVVRWINRGYLKAKQRGTNCKYDEWLLKDEWVRDFVLAHPVAFDIRKVDQVWFLNMLMQGKLCGYNAANS